MKKIIFIISFLVPITMFSQNWKSNFEEAKAEAMKQEKNILLVFSGSDWCAPCIKLDKNIWQSEEFKKYSDQNYILYKADFPSLHLLLCCNSLLLYSKSPKETTDSCYLTIFPFSIKIVKVCDIRT